MARKEKERSNKRKAAMEVAKVSGKKAKEAKEVLKKKRSKRDEETEEDGSDDELSGVAEGEGNEDDEAETSDSETGGSLHETMRINEAHVEATKRLVQKKKETEKMDAMIADVDKLQAKKMHELAQKRNAFPDEVKCMSISCLQLFVSLELSYSENLICGQDAEEEKKPARLSTSSGKASEVDWGPWYVFTVKSNATALQRHIVPWFIALMGLEYAKSIKIKMVKEMVLALCSDLHFVAFDGEEMAAEYPFGLTEVSRRAKVAAGTNAFVHFLFIPCSDCMPVCAEKALGKHRILIRNALIQMFERPLPASESVSREVLSKILGRKDIDWSKPVLEVESNVHLSALGRAGVPNVVWETLERKAANMRSVLDPIMNAGQEILLDLLGT